MPKIKDIAKDMDAGRVRARLVNDLFNQSIILDGELKDYGHLFTKAEKKLMDKLHGLMGELHAVLDGNEDKRMDIFKASRAED